MKIYLPQEYSLKTIHEGAQNTVQNYKPDKMDAILDLCQKKTIRCLYTENTDTTIHSNVLQSISRNYKEYINHLEDIGIVKVCNAFVPGEYSKGYQFTFKYTEPLKGHDYNRDNKYLVDDKINYIEDNITVNRLKTFLHFLKLDYESASKFSLELKDKRELQPEQHFCKKLINKEWIQNPYSGKWELIKGPFYKNAWMQHHLEMIAFDKLAIGSFNSGRDTTGLRLHTPLTSLPKEFRKFLSCKGEKLVNIDISNSQPFISLLLFNPAFWLSDNITVRAYKVFKKLFPDVNTTSLINLDTIRMAEYFEKDENLYISILTSIASKGADFKNFKNQVCSGTLYPYLSNMLKMKFGLSLSPDEVKPSIFTILFTSNRFINQPEALPKRYFKEIFPSVYEVFKDIKTERKSYPVLLGGTVRKRSALLAIMLQRIESYLIIDVICKRLISENCNIPLFTIHDSISTTLTHQETVETIIKEEIERYIGYAPQIKREKWEY